MKLTPVQVDGWLYTGMGVFGFLTVTFGSDESYKYVNPYLVFWLKVFFGCGLAGCTALKTFRSTAYADHLKNQNGNSKPPIAPPTP